MALFLSEDLDNFLILDEEYVTTEELIELAIDSTRELSEFNEALYHLDFQHHVATTQQIDYYEEAYGLPREYDDIHRPEYDTDYVLGRKKPAYTPADANHGSFLQRAIRAIANFIIKVKNIIVGFFTKLYFKIREIIGKVTGKELQVAEGADERLSEMIHTLEEIKQIEQHRGTSMFVKAFFKLKQLLVDTYFKLKDFAVKAVRFVQASPNFIRNAQALVTLALGLQFMYKRLTSEEERQAKELEKQIALAIQHGEPANSPTIKALENRIKDLRNKAKANAETVGLVGQILTAFSQLFKNASEAQKYANMSDAEVEARIKKTRKEAKKIKKKLRKLGADDSDPTPEDIANMKFEDEEDD